MELSITDSCSGLETVIIEEGVKTIGNGVSYSCSSLKNIIIPCQLDIPKINHKPKDVYCFRCLVVCSNHWTWLNPLVLVLHNKLIKLTVDVFDLRSAARRCMVHAGSARMRARGPFFLAASHKDNDSDNQQNGRN